MSEMKEGAALKHWTIDKRVPLALILALAATVFTQTVAVAWWASSTSSRIEALEKKVDATAPQGERLTRVEVRLDNVVDGISEIKALLRPPSTVIPK